MVILCVTCLGYSFVGSTSSMQLLVLNLTNLWSMWLKTYTRHSKKPHHITAETET